jgi:hypothetical protein
MKLKTIVVVGTSFSSAGGFEPDSQVRKVLPKYDDMPIPEKMEDCSWPAYFQELVPDIKIHNLARPGAGIEYLIRTVTEWIRKNDVKDTLFLLEMSGYGRMELWDDEIKKYVVCNWEYLAGEKRYKASIHSGQYWKDSPEFQQKIESKKEILENWMGAYINIGVVLQNLTDQMFNFVCMLKHRGIQFKLFGEPFVDSKLNGDALIASNYLKLHTGGKNYYSIHNWIIASGYQIKLVTKGENTDFHATVRGNKVIAESYYKQLESFL